MIKTAPCFWDYNYSVKTFWVLKTHEILQAVNHKFYVKCMKWRLFMDSDPYKFFSWFVLFVSGSVWKFFSMRIKVFFGQKFDWWMKGLLRSSCQISFWPSIFQLAIKLCLFIFSGVSLVAWHWCSHIVWSGVSKNTGCLLELNLLFFALITLLSAMLNCSLDVVGFFFLACAYVNMWSVTNISWI